MTKLTQRDVEKLTAEDMRDFMYGAIRDMIEGNTPDNVSFLYFMPAPPFGPELGAFMDIGPTKDAFVDQGFDNNDLARAAVNFASIVDYVPLIDSNKNTTDLNALISSGVKISKVYDSILNNLRVVDNKRSEKDEEKLQKLRALLYKDTVEADADTDDDELDTLDLDTADDDFDIDSIFSDGASLDEIVDDPNSISEPTKPKLLYDLLEARFNQVELNVLDELRKISPHDPNAGRRIAIGQRKIKSARNRWEAQGRKTKIENILARIEQLSQGGMVQYVADLRERFDGSQISAAIFSDPELGPSLLTEEAYYTALRPNGILSQPSAMKVKIKSSEMDSNTFFQKKVTGGGFKVPFSFGSVGASGQKLSEDREKSFYRESFEISFEIIQGIVDRQWLDMAFLESRAYTTVDPDTGKPLDPLQEITLLSDGKTPPEDGHVKAIPVSVYFIRNLTVRSNAFSSLSQSEVDQIKGKAGLSLFGFGASGKHENTTIQTNFSKDETAGEITANGTYLVAMASRYLKQAPNPDFETWPKDQWV